MHRQFRISTIMVLAMAAPVLAAGAVTLDLSSPRDGDFMPPGASFEWVINATVSTGDNLGLSMISVDLVQDPGNPELFDLPQAQEVPIEMSCFERPEGVGNPPPDGYVSGYLGWPMGDPGQRNLAQIGGAQNSFGAAAGGMGSDVDVEPGIGQSPEGQDIAAGVFTVPDTLGDYTFSIEAPLANVIDAVNPPPDWSPVSAASTDLAGDSIGFSVCLPADANQDYVLTDADISLFVDLLLDVEPIGDYALCACDMNRDGIINGADIQGFVGASLPP